MNALEKKVLDESSKIDELMAEERAEHKKTKIELEKMKLKEMNKEFSDELKKAEEPFFLAGDSPLDEPNREKSL